MCELQREAEKIQVASLARRESSVRMQAQSQLPEVDDACLLSAASKDKGWLVDCIHSPSLDAINLVSAFDHMIESS